MERGGGIPRDTHVARIVIRMKYSNVLFSERAIQAFLEVRHEGEVDDAWLIVYILYIYNDSILILMLLRDWPR